MAVVGCDSCFCGLFRVEAHGWGHSMVDQTSLRLTLLLLLRDRFARLLCVLTRTPVRPSLFQAALASGGVGAYL